MIIRNLKTSAATALCLALLSSAAVAETFNIPSGDLKGALDAYAAQTGLNLVFPDDAVKGVRSRGAQGALSSDAALSRILTGTGFSAYRRSTGAIGIVRETGSRADTAVEPMVLAQAGPPRAAVETVTVTSSKLGGADVQSIPISITALS